MKKRCVSLKTLQLKPQTSLGPETMASFEINCTVAFVCLFAHAWMFGSVVLTRPRARPQGLGSTRARNTIPVYSSKILSAIISLLVIIALFIENNSPNTLNHSLCQTTVYVIFVCYMVVRIS